MKAGDTVRPRRAFVSFGGVVVVPATATGTVVAVEREVHPLWPFRVHFEGHPTGFTDGNWLCSEDEITLLDTMIRPEVQS